MQFSKFTTIAALLFVTLFGVALATPVARASTADIETAMNTLKENIAGPIASISTSIILSSCIPPLTHDCRVGREPDKPDVR
jgi:type IV secretory pathway VirB2 component (pilin)